MQFSQTNRCSILCVPRKLRAERSVGCDICPKNSAGKRKKNPGSTEQRPVMASLSRHRVLEKQLIHNACK